MVKRIPASLIVVVLALGLTATAAFAAGGGHALFAPQVAAPTEPINVGDETNPPQAGDTDETETPEAGENDEDSGQGDANETPGAHPTNHGLTVSQAAQATTPAGCKNHGQYVSMVARGLIDPNATPPVVEPGVEPPSVCATPTPDAAATPKPHGKPLSKPSHPVHPN